MSKTAKDVEDELDEIDGITMNRPASKDGKIKMWGVWLDGDVAGRKAGRVRVEGDEEQELTESEKADIFFSEAVQQFNKGRYAPAAALLERAVGMTEGGARSRRGGEYNLWRAQALFAQGEATQDVELRRAGAKLLRELKTHQDGAVSRVSEEILYIMEAPKLELDKTSFQTIPDLTKLDAFSKKRLKSGKQGGYAEIKKGPKKGSLEWLQEQPRSKGPPPPMDPAPTLAAIALCLASLPLFTNQ